VFGVGNKVGNVAIVRCVWPVLFKDCGAKRVDFAEDVFDLFVIKDLLYC
jgi:hypothetical protein